MESHLCSSDVCSRLFEASSSHTGDALTCLSSPSACDYLATRIWLSDISNVPSFCDSLHTGLCVGGAQRSRLYVRTLNMSFRFSG